jgi:hypothetical protein
MLQPTTNAAREALSRFAPVPSSPAPSVPPTPSGIARGTGMAAGVATEAPTGSLAAADLMFLEDWERNRAPGIAAALRASQIRRADPALAAAIRLELSGRR